MNGPPPNGQSTYYKMSLATEDSLSSHEKSASYLAQVTRTKRGEATSDTTKEKLLEHNNSPTHLRNVKLAEKRDAKRAQSKWRYHNYFAMQFVVSQSHRGWPVEPRKFGNTYQNGCALGEAHRRLRGGHNRRLLSEAKNVEPFHPLWRKS